MSTLEQASFPPLDRTADGTVHPEPDVAWVSPYKGRPLATQPGEPLRREGAAVQVIAAAAVLALVLVLCFVAPAPLWATQPTVPPPAGSAATWKPFSLLGLLIAVGLLAAFLVPFYPYARALRALRAGSPSPRLVLLLTLGLGLVALAIYPVWGSDVFEYLAKERMWAIYGANPLTATPSLHPQDWAYVYSWAPTRTNAYGPLWPLLTWPIGVLVQTPFQAALAYKLLALFGYLGSSALIWRLAPRPRALGALVYFAWSPLVLFEVLGKAHNDVLLALGALAAIALAERRSSAVLALPATTAALLVKASVAPLGLLLVVAQARQGAWRTALLGALLSGCLAIALFAPFWNGPALLESVRQQSSILDWSPLTLLLLASQAVGGADAQMAARGISAAACLVLTVVLLARWRRWTTAGLASVAAILLLLAYLLLTSDFYAHYLVPVVALAAISDSPRLRRFVAALSFGSLCAYAVELGAAAFGSAWIGSLGYLVTGSLLEVVPPAAVLALSLVQARRMTPAVRLRTAC